MTPRVALRLTRPFTLLPPFLGGLSGAVCAFGSAHNPDRTLTLGLVLAVAVGSFCAALLNAASNVLNQITDLVNDRINKPDRPLPAGEVSEQEARALTAALYLLALVPTWWLVVPPVPGFLERALSPLARHECFLLYLAGFVFTLVYSLPAFGRTKRFGYGANLTIAVPRGCLLKVAGWTMVASATCAEPWVIGLLFALFLFGASSTKDFSDQEGDRADGCRTLPIVHGNAGAVRRIAPFFVLPWVLLPVLTWLPDPADAQRRLLTGNPILLTGLGVLLSGWGAYTVYLLSRNPEELSASENHPSWTHMYLMMMVAQIGFALAYLLP